MSGLPQLFMPGYKNLQKMQLFSVGDYFKGFAIMAQSDAGYKSYSEFLAEGAAPDEALRQAVGQMEGKSFAYPAEAAIKGFIDLALARGGVALDDMSAVVAPDAETTRLMQSNRADFQVGGVPSRLTLQVEDYKPIVTSGGATTGAILAWHQSEPGAEVPASVKGFACADGGYHRSRDQRANARHAHQTETVALSLADLLDLLGDRPDALVEPQPVLVEADDQIAHAW